MVLFLSPQRGSGWCNFLQWKSSDCMWDKRDLLKSGCGNLSGDVNQEKRVEIRDRYPVYSMH